MESIYESYTNDVIISEMEQLDEFIIAGIGVAITAGLILRVVDGFLGNKPKLIHYITALIKWATEEYSGSLDITEIRKYAYENLEAKKELDMYKSDSSSKIISRQILKGLKKGSKEFAKILGTVIAILANKANLSKSDLTKAITI